MTSPAFFTVHRDLPREGPGLAEDVAWAGHLARVPADGRLCDAGCGPGADIAALRRLVPEGRVDGVDLVPHFVAAARDRYATDPAITVTDTSMEHLKGPYDLIWCAGALYFLGISKALGLWRAALTPAGAVAFTHPAYWEDSPSGAARAFWAEDPCQSDAANRAEISAAGWGVIGARRLTDDAWNAYYGPMLARCDGLEAAGMTADVAAAVAEARAEAAAWRAVSSETGYMAYVVRPL